MTVDPCASVRSLDLVFIPEKKGVFMNRFSAAGGSLRNWSWVPSLYFAEGLPAALVTMVSLVMFSTLKIPAEKTLFWTGLFSLPWMLRPLWVPVIDRFGTPRRWTVILEMVMGGLFVCAGFFASSISLFGLLCCCFFAADCSGR